MSSGVFFVAPLGIIVQFPVIHGAVSMAGTSIRRSTDTACRRGRESDVTFAAGFARTLAPAGRARNGRRST